jgi:hypothetical protein
MAVPVKAGIATPTHARTMSRLAAPHGEQTNQPSVRGEISCASETETNKARVTPVTGSDLHQSTTLLGVCEADRAGLGIWERHMPTHGIDKFDPKKPNLSSLTPNKLLKNVFYKIIFFLDVSRRTS